MSFNEKLPAWKNPGVEPPESLKKEGWKPGQKPPADYFDWLHYRTYKSLEELQEKAETKEGSQRKASQAERNAKNYTDEQVSEIVVPVKSVNGKTGEVELDKNDVGLGKVIDDRQATKTEFDTHVDNNERHISVIPYRKADASGDDYPEGISVFSTPSGQGTGIADGWPVNLITVETVKQGNY